jgi:hypothetical protein
MSVLFLFFSSKDHTCFSKTREADSGSCPGRKAGKGDSRNATTRAKTTPSRRRRK